MVTQIISNALILFHIIPVAPSFQEVEVYFNWIVVVKTRIVRVLEDLSHERLEVLSLGHRVLSDVVPVPRVGRPRSSKSPSSSQCSSLIFVIIVSACLKIVTINIDNTSRWFKCIYRITISEKGAATSYRTVIQGVNLSPGSGRPGDRFSVRVSVGVALRQRTSSWEQT